MFYNFVAFIRGVNKNLIFNDNSVSNISRSFLFDTALFNIVINIKYSDDIILLKILIFAGTRSVTTYMATFLQSIRFIKIHHRLLLIDLRAASEYILLLHTSHFNNSEK